MNSQNNTSCLLRYAEAKTARNYLIISVLTLKNSVTKRNKTFVNNCKSNTYKHAIVTNFVTLA